MNKKQISKILTKSDADTVKKMADHIKDNTEIVIVKKPQKALCMIKMREPVKESLFYIGEVIVMDAVVTVNGIAGHSVSMTLDEDKALNMAIIDGGIAAGVKDFDKELLELEKLQILEEEKKNSLFVKTMVNFNTI
ncbi:MAG: phosphonate C-P lyase system protein PhnG [Erysipelotrichaceae bacterium]|nr:phosphonate C-P lyase system protein PhnG [Erysipelotrichaceae bacterium]